MPEQQKDSESQKDEVEKDSKMHKKWQKDNELEILDDEEEPKGKKNKKSKDSKKQKKGDTLKDIDLHESEGKSKGKQIEKNSNGNTDNIDGHDRNKKKQKRRRSDDEEERGMCVKYRWLLSNVVHFIVIKKDFKTVSLKLTIPS